jgi:NADPH:quinone reductase
MRAVVVEQPGGPEALVRQDRPAPRPGSGQLLVDVAAAGLNYIDTYQRSGVYPLPMPAVLGLEGAGRVAEVGEGVTGWQVGDRLAWTDQLGSYAEQVLLSAERALRVPDGVDDRIAAATPLQGLTAHFLATSTYPVQPGDDVLVHAAAGGVGQLLVQVVKRRGGRVIATVSTEVKEQLARAAGADEVIRYDQQAFAPRVRELTGGRGVRVVYDGVGRDTFDGSLDSLGMRGMLVLFGAASGAPAPLEIQRLNAGGSLYLTRPTLFHYVADPAELARRGAELFGWVADGSLRVAVGASYPLADAAQAHTDLQARRTTAKTLLIP